MTKAASMTAFFQKAWDDLPDLETLPDPASPDLRGGGSICKHKGEAWVLVRGRWELLDDANKRIYRIETP